MANSLLFSFTTPALILSLLLLPFLYCVWNFFIVEPEGVFAKMMPYFGINNPESGCLGSKELIKIKERLLDDESMAGFSAGEDSANWEHAH